MTDDYELWSAKDCAAYLKLSYTTFLSRTQWTVGFPARCPVPGQPRWRARDVQRWAVGEREAA